MRKLHLALIVAGAGLLASCGGQADEQAAATPSAAATTPEPDPVAMSFLPEVIRASGTEPFWSADISKESVTYTTPENLGSGGVTASISRADGAENVKFTATIDGQVLDILVTPGSCSDGMSDKVYPWTVERTLGEETVSGCADRPNEVSSASEAKIP